MPDALFRLLIITIKPLLKKGKIFNIYVYYTALVILNLKFKKRIVEGYTKDKSWSKILFIL